jgi:hypothetical protein
MSGKLTRLVILLVGFGGAAPAAAEDMRSEEARQFIAGKMFAYNCFEGTRGAGRIYGDGSVVGYIQVRGGPPRYVALPSGTLRVKGDQYCASVRGIAFEPCFNVNRTSPYSFRGSVSGFRFAYCNFSRRSARAEIARGGPLRLRPTQSASAYSDQ